MRVMAGGIFDIAWLVIQGKAALTIQRYARGYITRRQFKKQVEQIKEVGR